MPYKSDAQRRFMHAKHPEIAARWDAEIRSSKRKKVAKAQFTTIPTKAKKLMARPGNLRGVETSHKNAKRGFIDVTERWGGRDNVFRKAPNAARTTTTTLEGKVTSSNVTYQPGQLTRTGKATVGGVAGATGAGYVVHRRNRKQVRKSMTSVSFWGVDHGEEISKAKDTRRTRDKKRAAVGAGYAGFLGGSAAGGSVGSRVSGGKGYLKTFKESTENAARAQGDLIDRSMGGRVEFGDLVRAGRQAQRATPGYRGMTRGGYVGGALGAASGYGALRAYRKQK